MPQSKPQLVVSASSIQGVGVHTQDSVEPGTPLFAVRGVRREVMNELKEMLKEKLIAQDDDRRAQEDVQKLTDKHVADIDHAMADKEKELMQV